MHSWMHANLPVHTFGTVHEEKTPNKPGQASTICSKLIGSLCWGELVWRVGIRLHRHTQQIHFAVSFFKFGMLGVVQSISLDCPRLHRHMQQIHFPILGKPGFTQLHDMMSLHKIAYVLCTRLAQFLAKRHPKTCAAIFGSLCCTEEWDAPNPNDENQNQSSVH